MATIVGRKRRDGSTAYMAQIIIHRKGIKHSEVKTFDDKREAKAWAAWREGELAKPGALEAAAAPSSTLGDAIDKYLAEKTTIGRTKAQVLRTIGKSKIASMDCAAIRSSDIVAFADSLNCKPQTRANYVSHLAAIFRLAKPAWGMSLDYDEMKAAQVVLHDLEKTAKSSKRDRRPTLAELDLILQHFTDRQARTPHAAPMVKIIIFALFSSRRLEEITRIQWDDLDGDRILVRSMKHPGQKVGNDVYVDLPPEALRIINTMPKVKPQIFPYSTDAIGASFTRACALLEIEDLHFHDLRHEAVSRLFELGWSIPHVAAVSGHRSWSSLQRYTQIRTKGDKFENWKWLDVVAPQPQEQPETV